MRDERRELGGESEPGEHVAPDADQYPFPVDDHVQTDEDDAEFAGDEVQPTPDNERLEAHRDVEQVARDENAAECGDEHINEDADVEDVAHAGLMIEILE